MSVKSLVVMSRSRRNDMTCRCWCRPPRRAAVMHFSATGRMALARVSVVTRDSAANNDATRLPSIAFWWAASPPRRRPRFGVACMAEPSVLGAQREAALVEPLDDLVEGLLPEVGDAEQVVEGLVHELADRVDLGPLQAVAGTLGQVELLDAQVEVRRAAGGGPGLAQLEAAGGLF